MQRLTFAPGFSSLVPERDHLRKALSTQRLTPHRSIPFDYERGLDLGRIPSKFQVSYPFEDLPAGSRTRRRVPVELLAHGRHKQLVLPDALVLPFIQTFAIAR